jgi:hypothetical protein
VMSHHFCISAWETPSEKLKPQIEDIFRNKVFAWYWGHEHRCATYGREGHGFYGACVGNGSFSEPWTVPSRSKSAHPSWYADSRCEVHSQNWPHGFLELELCTNSEGEPLPGLVLESYHLENVAAPHLRTLR